MRNKVSELAGLKKYLQAQKKAGVKFVDMHLNRRGYEMVRKFYPVETTTYVVYTTTFGSIANISNAILKDIHYSSARGTSRLYLKTLTKFDLKTLKKNGVRFHPYAYRIYL